MEAPAAAMANPLYAQTGALMHSEYEHVPYRPEEMLWDDGGLLPPHALAAPRTECKRDPGKPLEGYDEQSPMYATVPVGTPPKQPPSQPPSPPPAPASSKTFPLFRMLYSSPSRTIPAAGRAAAAAPADDAQAGSSRRLKCNQFTCGALAVVVVIVVVIVMFALFTGSRGGGLCTCPDPHALSTLSASVATLTSQNNAIIANMSTYILQATSALVPRLMERLAALNTTVDRMSKLTVFPGVIVPYSGALAVIPDGWALCDGKNGTPDLRSRFLVGAVSMEDYYQGVPLPYNLTLRPQGELGGEERHTLSVDEMPRHTHAVTAAIAWGWSSDKTASQASFPDSMSGRAFNSYEGGSAPHNNLPPYYALFYIMKL